jgi:hypothetical protein
MAVSCSLNATPTAPDHGDTLIVTYQVDGNDPIDPQGATVRGTVVVGGATYNVSTDITLPGTPAADVEYGTPTCDSLTFAQGASGAEFTAVIP